MHVLILFCLFLPLIWITNVPTISFERSACPLARTSAFTKSKRAASLKWCQENVSLFFSFVLFCCFFLFFTLGRFFLPFWWGKGVKKAPRILQLALISFPNNERGPIAWILNFDEAFFFFLAAVDLRQLGYQNSSTLCQLCEILNIIISIFASQMSFNINMQNTCSL